MSEEALLDGPLVAVVIPAWDDYVERDLERAVVSVTSQDLPARVIVVDNASRTPIPPLDGVSVISTERRLSRGAARNLGLDVVTEPFVVFLDADDVMLPGSLAALLDGIRATQDAVAHGLPIIDGLSGRLFRAPRRVARLASSRPGLFAALNSVWSLMPTQGATILRTDAVRAAGGYGDRDQSEDWMLGARLAARGRVTFGSVPVLVYHRRSTASPTVRELLEGARAVRAHLVDDPEVGGRSRSLAPILGAAQVAAVVARPVFLALRGARPRRRPRAEPAVEARELAGAVAGD